MYDRQPLRETLGGLKVEYRVVSLYSRDVGQREAKLAFNVGQGTQDLGFRSEVDVLFRCLPARPVVFRVKDENGQPTMASFVIRDAKGRVYPSQAKRLAPDFSFHPQVYRADGETVRLPEGNYTVEFSRGPESLTKLTTMSVTPQLAEANFQVERWIDPSKLGWWSGDHHIHAAGCAHYTKPSEGVHAAPWTLAAATAPIAMGPDQFIDRREFDPADLGGYLRGLPFAQSRRDRETDSALRA